MNMYFALVTYLSEKNYYGTKQVFTARYCHYSFSVSTDPKSLCKFENNSGIAVTASPQFSPNRFIFCVCMLDFNKSLA